MCADHEDAGIRRNVAFESSDLFGGIGAPLEELAPHHAVLGIDCEQAMLGRGDHRQKVVTHRLPEEFARQRVKPPLRVQHIGLVARIFTTCHVAFRSVKPAADGRQVG